MTPVASPEFDRVIEADWTWTGSRFERGVRIAVSEGGRIEDFGSLTSEPTLRLKRCGLLPGFISAHSHAFQRGLRGRAEQYPELPGSFWSWRDAMYELAASLDAEDVLRLSRQAFSEMLQAGITSVGEFHYLHHANRKFDLDDAVLEAARQAGIRVRLLNCFYRSGGIGRPLEGPQLRFDGFSLDDFWSQADRLAGYEDDMISLGVAAHSVRAVPISELAELHAEAKQRGIPFHIHVEEQPAEIEECLSSHDRRPLQLLLDRLDPGPEFTAVHCTHSHASDLRELVAGGSSVCICPTTEANLGDGLPDLPLLDSLNANLCLGTDSNSRLCMLEEMRWLEYGQRQRLQRRGVLRGAAGNVASRLLEAATIHGASSLGMKDYGLESGAPADFAVVDLNAPALQGWTAETLLEMLVFGCGNEAIAGAIVAGRPAFGRGPLIGR